MPVWYGNISSLDDEIERASALGFDYVEISLDFPWPEILGSREISRLLKLGQARRIGFAFHAPPEGVEIASPFERTRNAAIKFIKHQISWSARFRPLYFNLHGDSGVPVENSLSEERVLASCALSMREIWGFGRKKGTRVTLENTPDPVFGLASSIDRVMASSGASLCLDTGHAQIINDISKEALGKENRPILGWVKRWKGKIGAIHMHNVKKMADHYPLDCGKINLRQVFFALRKSAPGRCILLEIMKEKKGAVRKVSDRTFRESLGLVRKWEKS